MLGVIEHLVMEVTDSQIHLKVFDLIDRLTVDKQPAIFLEV